MSQPNVSLYNGIFVVDKPSGFTSFDVVAKMRGIVSTRKVGHGGTLDPMATGVLPVFVGSALKAVDLQPDQDKVYEASIQFGLSTDTGDITGKPVQASDDTVERAELCAALPFFVGKQLQVPPMYSAVKVAGKPLYKYARAGVTVERSSRSVEIFSIEYLGMAASGQFQIRVHCSKGTYVRTLVEQIGNKIGVPATLAGLRRTKAGVFDIFQAVGLEQLQAAKDRQGLQKLLYPIDVLFLHLPVVSLKTEEWQRLKNGAQVYEINEKPGLARAYFRDNFVGLVRTESTGIMCSVKMFPINEQ